MFDLEEFKRELYSHLTKFPKYNYLVGSTSLKPTRFVTTSVKISNNQLGIEHDMETICLIFMILLTSEVLEHLDIFEYHHNKGIPLYHEGVYYFTSDAQFFGLDESKIHYYPLIDNTKYILCDEPIADLENFIEDIELINNEVRIKFPIYT